MKNWKEYKGHSFELLGTRNKFDNTIYTFDIETTSFIILDGEQLSPDKYEDLDQKDKERCIQMSNMYIWMFGINDVVYYGRSWQELEYFLMNIEYYTHDKKKFVFVHNLSYEFQFLRNHFKIKDVFSRKSRKVMKCSLEDYNFEFRCTYYMSGVALEKLPEIYGLDVKKLVGYLDYNIPRNKYTKLTEKELEYCENDCLVVYQYIQKELETYETLKAIPMTSTGHVRRELKEKTEKDYQYRSYVRKSVNIDPHVYNLLLDAFAGGYTHANWTLADEIIKDVDSFDFTSSYPYCMTTFKYPGTEFKKCSIKKIDSLLDCFAYLIRIRFKNIKCKYYNNFISMSKCKLIKKGSYDNGRVIGAEELEIVLTDVDLKFISKVYTYDSYEILESYWSVYKYLPKQFIEFILEKYVNKTKYKNVAGKELEYALEKAKFNSLYGMSVTNNIKDEVKYDNESGWSETPITNEEIVQKLEKEKKLGFLSFSYGVWITAWARFNLLKNLAKLDTHVIYADTDSLKVYGDYDKSVIDNYNIEVENRIKRVSEELDIPIEKFAPKDSEGIPHMLGVFDFDGHYEEFITQGAKKYAYTKYIKNSKLKETSNILEKGPEKSLVLEITVSGIPKKGARSLKTLNDFRDNHIFEHKDTGKNILLYNDEMIDYDMKDCQGNIEHLTNRFGCTILPTTYELGKALDYANLISDESSKRSIYKE